MLVYQPPCQITFSSCCLSNWTWFFLCDSLWESFWEQMVRWIEKPSDWYRSHGYRCQQILCCSSGSSPENNWHPLQLGVFSQAEISLVDKFSKAIDKWMASKKVAATSLHLLSWLNKGRPNRCCTWAGSVVAVDISCNTAQVFSQTRKQGAAPAQAFTMWNTGILGFIQI